MSPFDYVILRAAPRIQRGEFINVGAVLYCRALDYLGAAWDVNPERLKADFALISDTEMFAPDLPTLNVGLRGLIYTELEATGAKVDRELTAAITPSLLEEVIGLVPDEWIADGDRERYLGHLLARLSQRSAWVPGGAR